jgi:rhodanese-related sulfurtransferase
VKVVTACQRGGRAGRAAELLTRHGWEVIGICGMFDWKEKGVPLVFPPAKAEEKKAEEKK